MEQRLVREGIEAVCGLLVSEQRLELDRPDLYMLWLDYVGCVDICDVDYERKRCRWLLHYFLLHGKR